MRISDWSSDVCSSDLVGILLGFQPGKHGAVGTSTTKLRDDVGVEKEHLQCFGNAALTGTPGRNRKVAAFTIRKEQLLKRGARALLNSMPFGRRHEHRRFDTSLGDHLRSEEHTSELQSLMRISYAVFCLKKKKKN